MTATISRICALALGMAIGCGGDDGSSAPPATWPARASSCGQLGEDCTSCSGNGICYATSPSICVPPSASGLMCFPGSCTGGKPYCVAGRCLTLAEATCVCTGRIGSGLQECATPSEAARTE